MEKDNSLVEKYLEKVKEKQLQEAQGGYWGDDNYFIKSLNKLVGYKIKKVMQLPDWLTGEIYLGLELQKGEDTRDIWFLRDEEGNGPGFFAIEDEFSDDELKGI